MWEFDLLIIGSYRHMNAGLILSGTLSFFLQIQYITSEIAQIWCGCGLQNWVTRRCTEVAYRGQITQVGRPSRSPIELLPIVEESLLHIPHLSRPCTDSAILWVD